MHHWKVAYMRRGSEPPYPFGRTCEIVCAETRDEAKRCVPASPGYRITASRTDAKTRYGQTCHCLKSQEA